MLRSSRNRVKVDMSDSLKKARRKADKLAIPRASYHLLMCCDRKTAKCAGSDQMQASWKYLRHRAKELKRELSLRILQTRCPCLDICKGGPILVVYPTGVWYGQCDPEVIEQILQEHLLGGRVVEQYVIARLPVDPPQAPDRPQDIGP